MQVDSPEKLRNVAVAGHNDTGKTTLVSALLYAGGVTTRLHRVEDGNTLTDFDHEEIERKISIGLAACFVPWQQHKINLLDCPGYGIFFSETQQGLRAADSALLCVNGVAGVEVNTEKVWNAAAELELPLMVSLTKMDRERADFDRALEGLHKRFGRAVLPVQIPIGQEAGFTGVVDLVAQKAYQFTRDGNGKATPTDIPAELAERSRPTARRLVEAVAETDDKLMEGFFENGTISQEDLVAGLRRAVARRQIFPLTLSSGGHGIGPSALLDAVLALRPLPRRPHPLPGEERRRRGDRARRRSRGAARGAGLQDPLRPLHRQDLAAARRLRHAQRRHHVWNSRAEEAERLGHLMPLEGKQGTQRARA